jgi:hypothetical protein
MRVNERRSWGAAQLAKLEILASDLEPKFKSRRYDRRRLNGNRRFGVLMAARRRSLALGRELRAKVMEREQAAAKAQADLIMEQMRELSRVRYGDYGR